MQLSAWRLPSALRSLVFRSSSLNTKLGASGLAIVLQKSGFDRGTENVVGSDEKLGVMGEERVVSAGPVSRLPAEYGWPAVDVAGFRVEVILRLGGIEVVVFALGDIDGKSRAFAQHLRGDDGVGGEVFAILDLVSTIALRVARVLWRALDHHAGWKIDISVFLHTASGVARLGATAELGIVVLGIARTRREVAEKGRLRWERRVGCGEVVQELLRKLRGTVSSEFGRALIPTGGRQGRRRRGRGSGAGRFFIDLILHLASSLPWTRELLAIFHRESMLGVQLDFRFNFQLDKEVAKGRDACRGKRKGSLRVQGSIWTRMRELSATGTKRARALLLCGNPPGSDISAPVLATGRSRPALQREKASKGPKAAYYLAS
ncbi:hypothetical protein C8R45DRAFT_1079676 [Mycena sanguinolenta]|nr:hypothetical protein C8R45DRAFT_1079676 [Mycena sanguinolenta]